VTSEQALVQLYREAAARLRADVRAALESGNLGTAIYLQRQLTALRGVLRQLGVRTRPLAIGAALEAYAGGVRIANLGAPGASFAFAGVHREAVAAVADNLATPLALARDLVGRRAEGALRRAALTEVGTGLAEGATRAQVSDALARRLVREGTVDALTGLVDRAGRRWSIDVYARMVARTTTREAVSVGTKNRMLETGQDLITISDHGPTDDLCALYAGNTYSLSGKHPDHPPMPDEAWPPYHPNCQHVATPGSGDLDADVDALIASLAVGAAA
jgi:hypothetical protein